MARHVRQRFARIVRVFQHLRVGIAVAGNNVGVLSQRPRKIHFYALRAHAACGFGDGIITDALGVQHVALVDIKQRDVGGNAVEQVEFSADFIRIRRFWRQVADVARDGRLRHKRLGIVGKQRDCRRELVNQAQLRRPLVIAAVGVDVKRAAFARVLGVILVAQSGDGDPFIGQVQRVLSVGGVALLLNGLVAVGRRDGGALVEIPIRRIVDIETFDVLTAHHIRTQQIVILIRHAGQDFVVETGDIHVPLQIRSRRMHPLGGALSGIHAAGQVASF